MLIGAHDPSNPIAEIPPHDDNVTEDANSVDNNEPLNMPSITHTTTANFPNPALSQHGAQQTTVKEFGMPAVQAPTPSNTISNVGEKKLKLRCRHLQCPSSLRIFL